MSKLAERLARVAADPNLCHSAARWRLHERVYPGRGATFVVQSYEQRGGDTDLITSFETLLAELCAKAPDDAEITYCEWALGVLREGAPDAG
ncbi:MAG: hypothetical protein ABW167_16555 [Baekduia sp.]